eukprot:g842.t1
MRVLGFPRLQEYGMVLAREQLKVVKGLRKPLLFEQVADEEDHGGRPEYLRSLGSGAQHRYHWRRIGCWRQHSADLVFGQDAPAEHGLASRKELRGGRTKEATHMEERKGERRDQGRAEPGHREARIPFDLPKCRLPREPWNAWPRYPHALDMAYGTGWMPSFLLLNSFYPVDNILNVIKAGANWLQLPVAYQTLQVIGGRSFADGLLNFATAPLYGIVPYCCEAFLYLLQMFSFLILPGMLLLFGMCYEFVGMFFAYSLDSRTTSHIPDMIFSAVVSGHSVEDWMKGLSSVSFVALIGSTVTANLMIYLICEWPDRNLPPPGIQHAVHQLVNAMGNMLVSSYVWVILSFAISSILWFAMVVVIYPEQMLTALACAGGLAAIFTSMTGLKNTKDELERMLYEEIPEVLELVCDSFLEQYDKTSSGRSKAVVATYRKLEEELAEKTADYVKERLKKNEKVKDGGCWICAWLAGLVGFAASLA